MFISTNIRKSHVKRFECHKNYKVEKVFYYESRENTFINSKPLSPYLLLKCNFAFSFRRSNLELGGGGNVWIGGQRRVQYRRGGLPFAGNFGSPSTKRDL